MPIEPDSADRPEGLETRPSSTPLPPQGDRPDWLVGAEDALGGEVDGPIRPTVADVPSAAASLRLVPGGKPDAPPKAWSGAASSVPKLSVVATPERASAHEDEEDDAQIPGPGSGLDSEVMVDGTAAPPRGRAPVFRPLDEPWYLVWSEVLLTNRKIQAVALTALVVIGAVVFWPKQGASGASLGSILRHPERFQGRSVVVRGEVLESFQVGQGHAFQLRQGRDVVVVYSTLREPRLHERVEVVGTVSTGYLDGSPRVAIFEGATAP